MVPCCNRKGYLLPVSSESDHLLVSCRGSTTRTRLSESPTSPTEVPPVTVVLVPGVPRPFYGRTWEGIRGEEGSLETRTTCNYVYVTGHTEGEETESRPVCHPQLFYTHLLIYLLIYLLTVDDGGSPVGPKSDKTIPWDRIRKSKVRVGTVRRTSLEVPQTDMPPWDCRGG